MLIVRWLFLVGFASLLSRPGKHPQKKFDGSNNGADPACYDQPTRPPEPAYEKGWHPQEDKHRRREGRYWLATSVLSAVVAIGAGLSARYTYSAASEAHEQAVQARRQADVAEDQLVATTRARLKLVAITDAYVRKAEGVDVAWFNFKPTYKNFGPTPAEDILFEPHIFVVGAGPSPKQACKTGPGWMTHDFPTDIIFPQDEGGGGWFGVQVPLQRLKEEAATVLAVQPATPIYLGVVGCLVYHSGNGKNTYVTAFVGDLHMDEGREVRPEDYIPLYDVLTAPDAPAEVGMKIKTLNAWTD